MSGGKPDPYELEYMSDGQSLARGRKRMPAYYHALFGVPLAALAGAAIATGVFPVLALAPVLLVPWLLFMHVRINVTREHVHVQLGLSGPKIPMAAITAASVEPYDAAKYGEKVIRTAKDGSTAYYVAGGSDRGVRIEYQEDDAPRSIFVSCENAAEIVAAIDRARAARSMAEGSAGRARARVEVSSDAGELDDEAGPGDVASRKHHSRSEDG